MTKILHSEYMILLFLTLSFQIISIAGITCDKYNITNFLQNDTITINFLSNNLLKLNRKIRCKSNSSLELINGCVHHCNELGYGQYGEIFVEMHHDNGTIETCFINYITELQAPSLSYLNVTGDKVRLGINRPIGSFDYVNVQCSDNESYILFNTNMLLNDSIVTVDCSFLSNMPLMSFVLETVKKDFDSAVKHINQEIPLPVPFNYSLNSLLLNITAYPPPPINLNSIYEFYLIFHDKNISYERIKVSNLNPKFGSIFNYNLIPNLKHTIIFKHIVNSIGYAQSNSTILPISNILYPYEVTNFQIKEKFHNIILNWIDPHSPDDPIEFIIFCNSSENSMIKVNRETTYICEQMTFNQTDIISVQTQVVIPGYIHDRIAVVEINVEQVPEIPEFEVFNKTENSITIRWNYNNNSLIKNLFEYTIKCNFNFNSTQINIQSNEYQCQSLNEGTVYVITIYLKNLNNTIQRSKSILANTLLKKCQYKNHFYSSDINGNRSIIIEWSPPEKNFEQIDVYCPYEFTTFKYRQIMPIMYVKCTVTSGVQFIVIFFTLKSGYESATFEFTDTPPIDSTTTTAISLPSPPPPTTTTMTSTAMITTTMTSTAMITTTTIGTQSTSTSTSSTTIESRGPSTTTSAAITELPPVTTSDYTQDLLSKIEMELTRWRTVAIIAFIFAGFLVLATICLTILSFLLYLRNRSNNIDE